MRWDDADGLTRRPDARVRGVVETWRDSLLDLSGDNPLIDVRRAAGDVVPVLSPSPRSVVEALQQGRECGFLGIEEQAEGPRPRAANVFQTPMTDAAMDATLHSLRRAARRDHSEHGLGTLYLALGTLHWRDHRREYASPILLLPVDLAIPNPLDYPRLRARLDDPIVNPALAVALREYGVELPTVEGLGSLDVTVFWARLDAAISDHPEWRTDEAILLARLTVHRELMYADLVGNERQIFAHPVVRALATDPKTQVTAFRFDPVPPRRIDATASPDDVPLVLDADAAQRSCIAAAVAGRTFVMRGAPGTGKSQTVANMIGCLLHAGKRVLLVSDKAAALDTVRERLSGAGLDDYLLELHSDRTGRAQVAVTLAAALDHIPLPPPSLSTDEREELRDHRRRLNAYAEAMNEVREPLGHRLHDVIGMCAQMTDVPAAPVPETLPVPLTTQSLQRVRDAAERLAHAWRPACEGEAFLWRDVIDQNRLDSRLHQAQLALEHLVETAAQDPLTAAFETHSLAELINLTGLVGHAARRPPETPDEWLTLPNLEPVARAAETLLGHLKTLHKAEQAVRNRAGVTWTALPSPGKLPIVPGLRLDPPPIEMLPLTAAQARGLARRFADEADRLEQHEHSLDRVTARLGLPNVVAFTDIGRLAAIVELLSRLDKPEPAWFGPNGIANAQAAARVLQHSVDVARLAETRARQNFTDAALAEPLDELIERFATTHRGFGRLRAAYRRDRRAVGEMARPGVGRTKAVSHLPDAVAWKHALDELDQAEREYAGILGHHWKRLDTDFDAIHTALKTAEDVQEVTPPEALPGVIERVCAAHPNNAIIRIVTEAGRDFERWTAALRPPPEPAPRPELAKGTVVDAISWLRAHVEPLSAAAELAQAYSAAAGRDFSLAESAAIGMLREGAADAATSLAKNATQHAKILGDVYRGEQTDVEGLDTAMAWASEARRIRTGSDVAFSAVQAEVLCRISPDDPLPARAAEWKAARDWILRAFAQRRHPALTATLDDYESARDLLHALLADTQGQQDWFEYETARTVLAEHGLDEVVDFCARENLAVEQILPVLGRALFQSWVDSVIRDDDRLKPLDTPARDLLVQEFRGWDARLERAAAADVMNAVDELQPSGSAAGEAAQLRAAASQQSRRLPVRDLIGKTRNATLAVKPCFVTVPADVSRLLPPDLYFDVVIVEEASRVPIADAIAAIYRGGSLVVAGDDRQLTAAALPGGTGPSVLDLAVHCGAFTVLDLTTHYRSRHESLIAFANHTFYQGMLNTFPAAMPAGPDAGVQLFPATADTSLVELVAGRVAHHFVTRPELTLGVVACTTELAGEIESRVSDMVKAPGDDRLRGFFVKDLDTVQGDERDVVILAIGPKLGGLDSPDGWRRLNVATTCAARRVEVVSAVRSRDLPGTDHLRPLAAYLDYAVRGETALGIEEESGGESQTPFEDSVSEVIRGWGYRVRTRVGTGAFRIDLAVRVSARRNAPYVLGIECDGTTYDSAPAARDRDRLREQVLQGLGWRLHRIWGTAWYSAREQEEERLRYAIEEAFAGIPPEPAPELTVTAEAAPVSAIPVSVVPVSAVPVSSEPLLEEIGLSADDTAEFEFVPYFAAVESEIDQEPVYVNGFGANHHEPAAAEADAYLAGMHDYDDHLVTAAAEDLEPEMFASLVPPEGEEPHEEEVAGPTVRAGGVRKPPTEVYADAEEPVTAVVEAEHFVKDWSKPYRRAKLPTVGAGAHLGDPEIHQKLLAAVRKIAQVEGPVHIDVALQRLREQWDLTRVTRQGRHIVEEAIEEAGVGWDGVFLRDPEQEPLVTVRYRADNVGRKAEQVCDDEVRIAMEHLVHDGGVLTLAEVLAATCRLFGWSSRHADELDDRLAGLVADLVAEGHLIRQADGLAAAHGLPDPLSLPHHDAAPRRTSRRRRSLQ
ncbi:DUF3320 domain-containing protein [Actinoplanes rectilineatus]|uniref:DUF3320 domain-containing protein n=1 Tax=Actinoplanes rectilineatus TaxID=113571 RepID=UPI0005F2A84F|nr:DUF3320 domain-containing protein [Actinoplanes rectilineatus]